MYIKNGITKYYYVDTYTLQNCTVTSPSIGTIRVSCDSSHQILVTLTCTNNCNNPMVTSNGSSPLTVRGLDPGMMYSVIINMFDGNQVVLIGRVERRTITVINATVTSGNFMMCISLNNLNPDGFFDLSLSLHIYSIIIKYNST